MARPARMIRIVLVGSLPNGEEFQTGLWVNYDAPGPTQSQLQAASDVVANAFQLNGTGIRALWCPATTLLEIRLYDYPDPGPAPAARIAVRSFVLPGTGSEAAGHPLQTSVVATLRTAIVGRSYRGRMYWPVTGIGLVNHQLSQATTQAVADATADFIEDLYAMPLPIRVPVVVSEVRSTATQVSGVTVDSKLDVQRRRSRQETELFQATSVIAP